MNDDIRTRSAVERRRRRDDGAIDRWLVLRDRVRPLGMPMKRAVIFKRRSPLGTGEEEPERMTGDPLPPHGFYPVSLNLVGRRCVVIGAAGDREAVEKVAALREVDADVRWITEPSALRDDDVADAFFVISTPQDEALSARLRTLADTHRFLLCTIDQPRHGFVAMQAIVRSGPVRIGISTGGVAPRVGKILKDALQHVLDEKFARFVECLKTQKLRNRSTLPERGARRAAVLAATDGFALEVRATYPRWFEEELNELEPRAAE